MLSGLRAVLLAAALVPASALAQDRPPRRASAFLPPDHWAVAAARRASVAGLVPLELGWPDASLTRLDIARILRSAVDSERHATPARAAVAVQHWERFAAEFPATVSLLDDEGQHFRLRGEGAMAAAYQSQSNEFVPGFAEWIQHGGTGPIPLAGRTGVAGELSWAASPASFLALELSPRYDREAWTRSEGYAVLQYRSAGIWLGRRSLRYGPGESGGLILNADAAFTGGGIRVAPTRLPWLLRHLGVVRFEGFLSEIDSSFAVKDPWVMVNHASLSPHPRLLLGLTHGAIFGGSGRPPFNARNFIAMVTLGRAVKGSADAEFENQLVSGEIRWRPPAGSLPLELHLEWGAEDNQGAWYQVPATQFGARLAAVPGIPSLSVGVERTEFEPPSPESGERGFHSNWYRHHIYEAGWTVDQVLLGHPLGGNGVEWLAWGRADLADARLRLEARAYMRERERYNIYSPDLKGFGNGGALRAAWRFGSGAEAMGAAEVELLGNDEVRTVGFAGVRVIF